MKMKIYFSFEAVSCLLARLLNASYAKNQEARLELVEPLNLTPETETLDIIPTVTN